MTRVQTDYNRNARKRRARAQMNEELRRLRKNPDDILTAKRIIAMPAGPDKAEVMAFARFLSHHGRPGAGDGSNICTCGVGARRDDAGAIHAVPNPECDCPCHEDGYAVGKA